MADILSFKAARKAKAKVAKEQAAAEDRIRFGMSKAERDARAAREKLAAAKLDSHKRED